MQTTTLITINSDGLAFDNSHRQLMRAKTDEQEISDFAAELEGALKELEKAFAEKKLVDEQLQTLQKDLDGRGFWGQLKNTFSSKTDKELAVMVKGLGASLGLTQSVVRVMLKIQTKKSRMLREFSDTLVRKILSIQSDTNTLDSNQKQAALFFLGEMQEQIYEQIRQQELVDSHESRLGDHEQWQRGKDERDASLVDRLSHIEAEKAVLKQQIDSLEPKLDVLEMSVDNHGSRLGDHEQWHKDKNEEMSVLISQLSQLEREKRAMENQIEFLVSKLATFEEAESKNRLPKAIFIRNLLPGTAFVFAGVALFLVLKG